MKIIAFLLMLFVPFAVQADDDMAQKIELAKEYTEMVNFDEEIKKTIEQVVVSVPMDKRAQFRSALERHIKIDQLETTSEVALAEIFTADELKAMLDFYKTPTGDSIRKKLPDYQNRLKPVLEQMVLQAAKSLQGQL